MSIKVILISRNNIKTIVILLLYILYYIIYFLNTLIDYDIIALGFF